MYEAYIEQSIRDDGFAVIGRVVDSATATAMRTALARIVEEDISRWSGNPWYKDHWMVHNLMMHDDLFLAFLENPVMHAYLGRLLSPACTLYAYTSSSLPAGGSNFSRRIHVDAQAESIDYVTNVGVLVALDDFSDENGATYFLPKSHLSLSVPSEDQFLRDAVRVYPKAGEAVIFNARTYHLGGENVTATARHAVTLNACRHWMKQRFDYPRMIGDERLAKLGVVGRRFVGMESRVPTTMEEYYVAPADRLFKARAT